MPHTTPTELQTAPQPANRAASLTVSPQSPGRTRQQYISQHHIAQSRRARVPGPYIFEPYQDLSETTPEPADHPTPQPQAVTVGANAILGVQLLWPLRFTLVLAGTAALYATYAVKDAESITTLVVRLSLFGLVCALPWGTSNLDLAVSRLLQVAALCIIAALGLNELRRQGSADLGTIALRWFLDSLGTLLGTCVRSSGKVFDLLGESWQILKCVCRRLFKRKKQVDPGVDSGYELLAQTVSTADEEESEEGSSAVDA
uniref:Uncharacterized protein n=1 Tax=Mycena chlorophos TaxID=658473 RepID=A0ABQ0LDC3_MYCCL|nr:predicted protein [Mycena chlorophos]